MNLSPAAPNTPIRTPQLRSSAKSLQLTPIWEEVVKNNRLPPDVNQDLIFKEISVRLEDLEWPVRQHAFRVLYDIIPIISKERLDERITQNNILAKLVVNLGHPAPGIRKVASETLQKYLKRTSQSEKMLENFLQYGVREKGLVSNDQAGILRENITLGTVVTLVDVLQPFVSPENGGYSLSQSFLTEIVEALLVQTKKPVYRAKCLETLRKIKEMMGDIRFRRTLDDLPDRENLLNLMNEGCQNEKTFFELRPSEDSFDLMLPKGEAENGHRNRHSSSEEFSDGSDTETYTKEPAPTLDDDTIYNMGRAEVSAYTPPSFVAVDRPDDFLPSGGAKGDDANESGPSSPRVVLEAEIQFAKSKAITMKVVESNEGQTDEQKRLTMNDGDLVMKVLHDSEEIAEEEKTRTPRRVRFGGEVIKLRTPDSDTADITIEIHDADGDETADAIATNAPAVATAEPEYKSHIPLPLIPVVKASSRDSSPSRRPETSTESSLAPKKASSRDPSPSRRPETSTESSLAPKNESFDSALSSSGSEEAVITMKWSDDDDDDDDRVWKWAEMRLVEDNILKDLRNKENWKIQYQALEQLKIVLINPKTMEKLEKSKHEKLNSLFRCLLHELPQSNSQQVTTLALSVVSQLIETLPKELILLDVQEIVQGLCRYVGGCKNLNLKIEAVQSLKTLFGILEPSAVIDILVGEHCLFSSSSKLRENSLLAIMYATMTFPSDSFDMDKILEKVITSAADVRRRVRHASLEAIAILAQFCSSRALTEALARVAETLPTPAAKAQLIAGVQARLSRRLLPSISTEGLVLYALQIPASRRFGNMGNPMGADVDWILSGTGSVSTGSAKSKTQLMTAQRLEIKPPPSATPSKWTQQDRGRRPQSKPRTCENPWKIQKYRTESTTANSASSQETACHLNGDHMNNDFLGLMDAEKRFRAEEITWALVPISALDEAPLGRERSTSLWGESFGETTTNYLSPPFGPLRPMYLKLQPTHEQLTLGRSSDDLRRSAHFHGEKKILEDFAEVRLLTPTILRERSYSDNHYRNKKFHPTDLKDTPTRIPVLCSSNTRNVLKPLRPTLPHGHDRKTSDPEISSPGSHKLNSIPNGFNGAPAFLPNIRAGHRDTAYDAQKSPTTSSKLEEVDEMKLQDTMVQLSGLLTASKGAGKSGGRDSQAGKPQSEAPFTANENTDPSVFEHRIQNKLFDRSYLKSRDTLPSTVASAPPVISTDSRDHVPSTSSSNSTDFGIFSGSDLRVRRPTNDPGNLNGSDGHSYGNYATYNPKMKGKKICLGKNSQNKVGNNGNPFPDNLKPFDRPKEGLETCFNQLESQQWEVNMLGLTSLVRLLRHHPAIVLAQLHPVIVALGRQVRNLRSQVARVACQASAEIFLALRRNVEPDLEELSGPLFHRSADTNRFIRADCNQALDNMVDSVGHAKAVSVIISKGTTHQNATVRAVAARLLLRLSEKAGAEKLLSLPKEARDKMLQAGANLLLEGKLETRAFAKQVFRVWSSHSSFANLILEAVEPSVMRHISKTLISLKS